MAEARVERRLAAILAALKGSNAQSMDQCGAFSSAFAALGKRSIFEFSGRAFPDPSNRPKKILVVW
jgi:hypothetical protein